MASQDTAGRVSLGKAGMVGPGKISLGKFWRGRKGWARQVSVGCVAVRQGHARQERPGGSVREWLDGHGSSGKSWKGPVGLGMARQLRLGRARSRRSSLGAARQER